MTAYYAVLEKEPNSLWSIWFPDLPGCVAAGETDELATINAISALRDWVELADENERISEPSSIETLRSRADILELQDSTVSFIRIPLYVNRNKSTRVNISLDAGILEAIDQAAKERGMTRSGFLAAAAEEKLLRSA